MLTESGTVKEEKTCEKTLV